MNFSIRDHLVLQVAAGSHSYGTTDENSDIDLRGVMIPPEEYFTGLQRFDQCESDPSFTDADVCYYDIRKFFTLAMKGNPNILEIFRSSIHMYLLPHARDILNMWPLMLSKQIVKSHLGMATGHLKKMNHPGRKCGTKGKRLIELYGYNTKDAMHIIRVLGQCVEILETGELTLPRPNSVVLLEIKNGKWPIGEVQVTAEALINDVKRLEEQSDLPKVPDFNLVSKRVMSIVSNFFYGLCPECGVVGAHNMDCPTIEILPLPCEATGNHEERVPRHLQRCQHVWHGNPALIIPCPECGEGEEPDNEKPRIEFLEGLPNVNYIRQYVHYVFVVKIDGRYKLTLTPPVIPQ